MLDSKSKNQDVIFKGINSEKQLIEAVTLALQRSVNGKIHIKTDMRSLYNPTRMKNIAKATENSLEKINRACPTCCCREFEAIETKRGLPCGLCNLPTAMIRTVIYQCKKCGFEQEALFPSSLEKADTAQCMYCNP